MRDFLAWLFDKGPQIASTPPSYAPPQPPRQDPNVRFGPLYHAQLDMNIRKGLLLDGGEPQRRYYATDEAWQLDCDVYAKWKAELVITR